MSVFGAFFWCEFFPAFGLNMETWTEYRVSLCIHSECGVIWARATQMRTLSTQMTSELSLVVLNLPLYFKLAVKSWLNDYEDMKLVVLTHVVLFH